jgi:hypothetical protein
MSDVWGRSEGAANQPIHKEDRGFVLQRAVWLRGDEVRAAADREIPGGPGRLRFSGGASRVTPWAGCRAG